MTTNLPGGQTWYFDPPPPDFFGKKYILVHTHTFLLRLQVKLGLGLFFIIYNRFVDYSKCGPHDFDPPPVKNSSRAPAIVAKY